MITGIFKELIKVNQRFIRVDVVHVISPWIRICTWSYSWRSNGYFVMILRFPLYFFTCFGSLTRFASLSCCALLTHFATLLSPTTLLACSLTLLSLASLSCCALLTHFATLLACSLTLLSSTALLACNLTLLACLSLLASDNIAYLLYMVHVDDTLICQPQDYILYECRVEYVHEIYKYNLLL